MSRLINVAKCFSPVSYRHFWNTVLVDGLFRKLLKNTSFLFSSTVIAGGLGFVQSIIVARALGVDNYGLWALVTTYVAMIRQIVDCRVWETVIKYVSEFWVKGDTERSMATVKLAYMVDFLTGVAAFAIAVLGVPIAARIFHQDQLAELVFITALGSLFATTNDTSMAILRVFDRFKWLASGEVLKSVVSLAVVGLVVFLGFGILGIAAAFAITSFLSAVLFTWYSLDVIRSTLWKAGRGGSIFLLSDRFREMAGFLFHTNLSALWSMIIRQSDVLILGYARGTSEVGLYQLAKNFVFMVARLHDPLYNSLFPEITKLWARGDVKQFNRFLAKLTIITSSVFLPIAVGLFFFSGMAVSLIFGAEYAPAVPAIQVMIWGVTIGCIFTWARPTIIAIGKPQTGNLASFVSTVFMLFLSLLLVPIHGFMASSAIWIIIYISGNSVLIAGYLHHLSRTRGHG